MQILFQGGHGTHETCDNNEWHYCRPLQPGGRVVPKTAVIVKADSPQPCCSGASFPIKLALLLLLVAYIVAPVAAQSIGDMITYVHAFNAGDSVEADFEAGAGVNIFNIVSVEGEVNAGFFIGTDLPAELRISYPEWVKSGTDFEISCNAEGMPGGRLGVKVQAGVRLTFSFIGDLVSINAINVDKTLDLVAELTTPIGNSISEEIEGRAELGSVTIPLVIAEVRVAVYLGVTASVSLQGTLISDFSTISKSLSSEIHKLMVWTENNETISEILSVRESATQDIQLGFSDTQLRLDTYSIVINSVFLELEAIGYTLPRLVLPIPPDRVASITRIDEHIGLTALDLNQREKIISFINGGLA